MLYFACPGSPPPTPVLVLQDRENACYKSKNTNFSVSPFPSNKRNPGVLDGCQPANPTRPPPKMKREASQGQDLPVRLRLSGSSVRGEAWMLLQPCALAPDDAQSKSWEIETYWRGRRRRILPAGCACQAERLV
ncbi:Hypothetical predicted protein [Podarcis lilfordi]|uniref:Uncharacterized protein n=1 Tax=Podarcis lilfordi TaxID=74358 RepID=A0AA35KMQ9_9SAUR|nr:Hypothetical predicted protein [Podarcis lilfordi]